MSTVSHWTYVLGWHQQIDGGGFDFTFTRLICFFCVANTYILTICFYSLIIPCRGSLYPLNLSVASIMCKVVHTRGLNGQPLTPAAQAATAQHFHTLTAAQAYVNDPQNQVYAPSIVLYCLDDSTTAAENDAALRELHNTLKASSHPILTLVGCNTTAEDILEFEKEVSRSTYKGRRGDGSINLEQQLDEK
jgi:hypothetical protein